MQDTGMTDKHFNGFVMFILDDINEVLEELKEGNKEKAKEKLEKVAENLKKHWRTEKRSVNNTVSKPKQAVLSSACTQNAK